MRIKLYAIGITSGLGLHDCPAPRERLRLFPLLALLKRVRALEIAAKRVLLLDLVDADLYIRSTAQSRPSRSEEG